MKDSRNGNCSVFILYTDIIRAHKELWERPFIHARARRQIEDAKRFMEMIKRPPYNRCNTISDLKKAISNEREQLKNELKEMDMYMEGHQFTLFDNPSNISERERMEKMQVIEIKKEELHWLHKTLGICSNPKYFA